MGVDISGRNPILRSPKLEYPDWKTTSDDENQLFFKEYKKWNDENPGYYFSSSWWGWRPILGLCQYVAYEYSIDIDFSNWDTNSGVGLETQEECNTLADALSEISFEIFEDDDIEELQLCMGSWVSLDGTFVSNEITEALDKQYKGKLIDSPLVLDDGTVVKSSHSVDKKHVQRFIAFLRECGGFEIW